MTLEEALNYKPNASPQQTATKPSSVAGGYSAFSSGGLPTNNGGTTSGYSAFQGALNYNPTVTPRQQAKNEMSNLPPILKQLAQTGEGLGQGWQWLQQHVLNPAYQAVNETSIDAGIPKTLGLTKNDITVGTIGKGLGKGISLLGQAVARPVLDVVGGTMGLVQGKDYGAEINKSVQETGAYGQQAGEQALPAWLVGQVGGSVVNATLGASQLEEGGKQVFTGLMENDPEKITQGALALGGGVSMLHSAMPSNKMTPLLDSKGKPLLDIKGQPIMQPAKASPLLFNSAPFKQFATGMRELGQKYPSLKSFTDFMTPLSNLRELNYEANLKKQTEINQKALNMTPNQSNREKAWGQNTPEFLAKEGLTPQRNRKGNLDAEPTMNALDVKADSIQEPLLQYLDVATKTGRSFVSLDKAKAQALANINQSQFRARGESLFDMEARVESQFNAFKRITAQDIVAGKSESYINPKTGEIMLSAKDAYSYLNGSWKNANIKDLTVGEATKKTDFQIGQALKQSLVESMPSGDKTVPEMLNHLSNIRAAQQVLRIRDGKPMAGGGMATRFYGGLIGSIVGGGTPFSRFIGALSFSELAGMMNDPAMQTWQKEVLLGKLKESTTGKQLIEGATQEMLKMYAKQRATPLLGQPNEYQKSQEYLRQLNQTPAIAPPIAPPVTTLPDARQFTPGGELKNPNQSTIAPLANPSPVPTRNPKTGKMQRAYTSDPITPENLQRMLKFQEEIAKAESLSKQNTVLRALEQKNRTVIPKKKNPLRSELTQQQ